MKKAPNVPKTSRKKAIIIILFLVMVSIAVVAGVYFFNEYQKSQALLKNPAQATEADNKKLVEKVGKLIKLPNETPSVATVSDVSKLQNQTLFQNAQNGDKVLIFNKAKRAIVYRPSENLIVEIGNVVVDPGSPSVAPEAEKVSVVIYNGTGTAGYARTVGNELSSKFTNMTVEGTENASKGYEKTLVVDLSGKNKDFAGNLSKELDGEVGSLPEDESKPANADILIILGN